VVEVLVEVVVLVVVDVVVVVVDVEVVVVDVVGGKGSSYLKMSEVVFFL
jgi:hypothetical protein